ncbi:Probable acyl-CoA dehydrogenase FadE [Mycobacteroides abscessus subsp. abscessus]|nr:Probable acyl-CoA dehydrogenase FadE [Mycobacteroides abscessus subsp. abscessus]
MRIAYTPQQEELRAELRDYFARLITPERRAALSATTGEYGQGNVYREVVREMGRDGWLALGWPKEFGGQDRPTMDQLIFTDEAAIAGAPVPFLTINSVAPTIMHYGSEEQKRFFLPKIAAGELHFAIGYSEPGAGTDLASPPTPTTCGWRCAPTRMPRSTRASACSSCPPTPRASPGPRCTPWPAPTPARPTTRTCGCR